VLYAKRRQRSHRRHFGMRIVCSACATKLDWGRGAYRSPEARLKWFLMMIGLLLLFLAGLFAMARVFER
jgi:hypothetical protein